MGWQKKGSSKNFIICVLLLSFLIGLKIGSFCKRQVLALETCLCIYIWGCNNMRIFAATNKKKTYCILKLLFTRKKKNNTQKLKRKSWLHFCSLLKEQTIFFPKCEVYMNEKVCKKMGKWWCILTSIIGAHWTNVRKAIHKWIRIKYSTTSNVYTFSSSVWAKRKLYCEHTVS